MARSKMDPNQITQITFDEQLEATRVSVLPMEMALELDAEDGDSILTQKQMLVLQVQADELIDTSKYSRLSTTSRTTLTMVVMEQEVDMGEIFPGTVREICSPQIKFSTPTTVILQS